MSRLSMAAKTVTYNVCNFGDIRMSATVSTWFNVSVIDSSRDATIDVKYGTQYLPVFSYSSDPVSK